MVIVYWYTDSASTGKNGIRYCLMNGQRHLDHNMIKPVYDIDEQFQERTACV